MSALHDIEQLWDVSPEVWSLIEAETQRISLTTPFALAQVYSAICAEIIAQGRVRDTTTTAEKLKGLMTFTVKCPGGSVFHRDSRVICGTCGEDQGPCQACDGTGKVKHGEYTYHCLTCQLTEFTPRERRSYGGTEDMESRVKCECGAEVAMVIRRTGAGICVECSNKHLTETQVPVDWNLERRVEKSMQNKQKYVWRSPDRVLESFKAAVAVRFGPLEFTELGNVAGAEGIIEVQGGPFTFRVSHTGKVTVGPAETLVYLNGTLEVRSFDTLLDTVDQVDEPTACECCNTTENVTVGPCPYASDIHNDQTPVPLCEGCAHERAQDI